MRRAGDGDHGAQQLLMLELGCLIRRAIEEGRDALQLSILELG